jgi:hypothetical protein
MEEYVKDTRNRIGKILIADIQHKELLAQCCEGRSDRPWQAVRPPDPELSQWLTLPNFSSQYLGCDQDCA